LKTVYSPDGNVVTISWSSKKYDVRWRLQYKPFHWDDLWITRSIFFIDWYNLLL